MSQPIPPAGKPVPAGSIPHEKVAERAHALWEERGRPSDQDLDIWLEAERHLRGQSENKPEADESLSGDLEREMDEESSFPSRRSATSL